MRMQLALETGRPEQRPAAPTFAAFVKSTFRPLHLEVKCRPATRERYEYLLKQGVLEAFGELPLDASFLAPMRAYVAQLANRGVQPRPHVSFVRCVLRSAFELEVLERLPDMPPLPKSGRKLPDAPSREHVQTLLNEAKGWLRTAIGLAAFGGLRSGEVRALQVQDIDTVGNRIFVRRAFSAQKVLSPKSSNDRVVPLLSELDEILKPALRAKLPHARVVVTPKGTTPGRTHVLSALKRLEEKLGIRAWSFHSLRHFFISEMVRGGASIEAVRILAGHGKLDVTQRYVHAQGSELLAAIAHLSG